MEKRVGVGDTVLLIVHSSVETAALLVAVSLRPVLNQSWLVTGQSQLVHLGIGWITNTDGQTKGKRVSHFMHQLSICRFVLQAVHSSVFHRLITAQIRTSSPGVEDTHEEKDQSHNPLGIPPLNHMVLTSRTGAVQPNNTQKARVTFPVCEK